MRRQWKQMGTRRDWPTRVARVIAGESMLHSNGYRLLFLPMHPAAHRGYVYEHRVVAERMLGRFLHPDELVHHRNEVKADNRYENLTVVASVAEHRAHHVGMSDAAVAAEILNGATYRELQQRGVSTQRIRRVRNELGLPHDFGKGAKSRPARRRGFERTTARTRKSKEAKAA